MKSNHLIQPVVGLLAVLTLGACGTMNDSRYGGSAAPVSQTTSSGSSYPASTYPAETYPAGTYPATNYPATTQPAGAQTTQIYAGYGVVHSIQRVSQPPLVTGDGGSRMGLGTVAGAVVGGLAGSQVGGGSGKTAATLIGAAGGAYVGHEIENRQAEQQVEAQPDMLEITVRMTNGSYQVMLQPLHADFRVGDRVRVGEGVLERY